MTLARRRQMARLERLAAPRMEQIRVAKEQRELEILRLIYRDANIHAANLSLIILFGDPRIEEPLSSAWERCCNSRFPELLHDISKENVLSYLGPPFDRRGADLSAHVFQRRVMPNLPGANVQEKFALIFDRAPLWLIWFTWADATMEVLDLPRSDCSAIWKFRRSENDFFRWPVLPTGKFENIQMSDIEIAERRRKAEEGYALWDSLADEIGPRCGLLELKYRYPERFVK
jgi:hypothetical protein